MDNAIIENELKKINRKLDSHERQLDSLDSDRQILEEILGKLAEILEVWKSTRKHDETVRKDIKEEINMVADKTVAAVETSVEGLKSIVTKGKRNTKVSWFRRLIGR